MKHLKTMCLILFIWLIFVPAAMPVLCAEGCVFAHKSEWVDADTQDTFEAPEDCTVCRVEIKAATNLLAFDEDGCTDDYCVSGIGTPVSEVWEDDPPHDISHVVWYTDCRPTSVSLVEIAPDKADTIFLVAVAIVGILGVFIIAFTYGRLFGYEKAVEDMREINSRHTN
jgi:hypothetical protein